MAPLEGERGLEERPVNTRFACPLAKVSILTLERGVVRNVVSHSNERTDQVFHGCCPRVIPNRFDVRPMNILEPIIGLPLVFLPGKPVRQLHIVIRGIECLRGLQIPVMNICVLGQKFWALLVPDQIGGSNPFVKVYSSFWSEFVAIKRSPNLQAIEPGRPGI